MGGSGLSSVDARGRSAREGSGGQQRVVKRGRAGDRSREGRKPVARQPANQEQASDHTFTSHEANNDIIHLHQLISTQPHCALVETRKVPKPNSANNACNSCLDDINWEDEIKYDPRLRKQIDEYHHNLRERVQEGLSRNGLMSLEVGLNTNGFHRKERLKLHVGDVGGSHYQAMKKCDDLLQKRQHIDVAFHSVRETELKLSLKQVRGQGYDGASNMRGEFNGLQSLIMREYSSAYYVHCFAHQLQLVLVDIVRKHKDVSDFFTKISILLNVVGGSSKRRDLIRDINVKEMSKALGSGQLQTGTRLNQEQCLQRPGDTRWSSHYKTLKSLVGMFATIVKVLEIVEKDKNDWKIRDQGSNLLEYFQSFDFVFYLHLMLTILTITNSLSLALQRKDQDIVNAMKCVKSTRLNLDELRREKWEKVLDEVSDFCDNYDIVKLEIEDTYIDPKKRRHKSGITNKHYYQVDCFNDVIDWILQELDNRFSETSSQLLICSSAFSPRDSFHDFNLENLMSLAKLYPSDFNSGNLRDLSHQLGLYIADVRDDGRFSNIQTIAELSQIMVETRKHLCYPLVYQLLKLVLVLPVATATVERCFSAMKNVKTYLRNKIGDEYLSDSLICYVEKEEMKKVTNEAVVRRFMKM
uniref:OSJNBa0065B15.7 protein n=1 Tax=Oryza sativa subsp. japonica TaxID=39947 RepID=Q7XWU4_ORYSJ|nr:OSJNBa0065B15.7 [Oryza sativa Japonica Group]